MSATADQFQTLSDTTYHWSVYEPAVKCEIGCTALRINGGLVVFDPVPLADAAWKQLLALAPLRAILLTNGNHVRNTLALKTLHHIPVATAAETRRDITELRPEVVLLPNEVLYGIVPIAIPGATKGETAFCSSTGVMVLGDAVINTDPAAGLQLLPDKYCDDPKLNRASLRKLLDFDFHTLTFAHGTPVTTGAKEKLAALLASSS
jgi:glyoxylase-like metal-dependent hydrolase (beta-lactamase superfamily II)